MPGLVSGKTYFHKQNIFTNRQEHIYEDAKNNYCLYANTIHGFQF